jgi:hypothetical protein
MVISFWSDVYNIRTTTRDPRVKVKAWLAAELQQKKSLHRRTYAEDVNILLSELPWGIKKCGLSDGEPIHTLWRFLGPHFTTGSQLEILRSHVASDPDLVQHVRVEGTALTAKLAEAAATDGTDAYHTEKKFAWVRTLGEDIMKRRQALLTLAHLGDCNQHWVVDVKEKAIHYGDSLESPIPPDPLQNYEWWISQHSSTSFVLKDIPVTHQEDGSSCGVLADNGLNHFAWPKLFPLFKSSEARAAKMSAFIRVAIHLEEARATADANEGASPSALGSTIPSSDFTFQMVAPISLVVDNALQPTQSLKRPKGYSDAPSAPSSPEKKRTCKNQAGLRNSPPPGLLFPSTISAPTGITSSDNVFLDMPSLNKKKANAKIDSFFRVETAEAKSERNSQDFEIIAVTKEEQDLQDAHGLARRKARQRQCDRERQSKHRDKVRIQKVADGWIPNQKRVSMLEVVLNIAH